MPLWDREEVFPIIAAAIKYLHRAHRRLIHQREISAQLLRMPAGRELVRKVQRMRARNTPEWEAMAMVAQFSKLYPASAYEGEFIRRKVAGGYAYAPRNSRDDSEVPAEVLRNLEAQIDKKTGFQGDPKLRKVIELHAMRLAGDEMRRRGYTVKNVSAKEPYDLFCEKAGRCKYVEVKGTQGPGTEFVLTAGEVRFIKRNTAKCVLCVVHGIRVRRARKPKASGGEPRLREPFNLSAGELRPIAFTFTGK